MGKLNDITGMMFGNWKVLERIDDYISPSGYRKTQYLCECQCSERTIKPQLAANLIKHKTLSCGCLKGSNISKSKIRRNEYNLNGKYGVGYTSSGGEFYFDLEDYELIKNYCWHEDKAGYICACVNNEGLNTTIKMHRLVMNVTDSHIQIDHIKHKVNDNRKSKLRIVTPQNNAQNKRLLDNNSSGRTGVYLNKRDNKWIAQICENGKVIVLGRFEDYDSAVNARERAENKIFGEYSYKNSINKP